MGMLSRYVLGDKIQKGSLSSSLGQVMFKVAGA